MSTPLVVADTGWGASIPRWLIDEIQAERLALELGSMLPGRLTAGPIERVGNAEALAYLMTASLRAPLQHEHYECYFWLTGIVLKCQGRELPDFIQEKLTRGLSRDEQRALDDLKGDLYRRRGGKVRTPVLDEIRSAHKQAQKGQS